MTDRTLTELAIAQSWQLAVLIVVVAVTARVFARNRPHLAYILWLVVLAKCVTPPVWSSYAGVFSWIEAATHAGGDKTRLSVVAPPPASAAIVEPSSPRLRQVDVAVSMQPMAKVSPHAERDLRIERFEFSRVLLIVWLAGSMLIVLVSTVRWLGCWYRWQRSRVEIDHALESSLATLSRRLGLRRRVRLVITASRVGPAVVGVVRPTIVLPAAVTAGQSAAELEPILAHELLHVRRGDLWIGLVQLVAQAVWWFHPLVWLANRMLSREAERSCDEEVIAELRCPPARYARSLLTVLEQKRSLRAVPAFPGMRAVDITSQRLERIMGLGQGCRRRTPWWCWIVMLALAMLTLPGARLLVAWQDPARESQPAETGPLADLAKFLSKQKTTPAARRAPRVSVAAADSAAATGEDSTAPAQVGDNADSIITIEISAEMTNSLLAAARSEVGLEGAEAQRLLLETIFNRMAFDVLTRPERPEGETLQITDSAQDCLEFRFASHKGGLCSMHWRDDGRLVARLPSRESELVRRATEDIKAHGFRAVEISARFAWGPAELIDGLSNEWTALSGAAVAPGEEGFKRIEMTSHSLADADYKGPRANRASYSIEQELPLMVELLDAKRRDEVLDRLQNHRHTSLLQSPKVLLQSGQTASIADLSYTPFVVAVKPIVGKDATALEPQIRVVDSGFAFVARPVLKENLVHLDYELTLSEIKEVKEQRITLAGQTEATTVQVPVVARTRVESSIDLPLDKTLLLGGLKRLNDQGKEESFALILEAKAKLPENARPNATNEKTGVMRGAGVNSNAGLVGAIDMDFSRSLSQAPFRREQTAKSRLEAAQKNHKAVSEAYEKEQVTLDLLLDAERRLVDCELASAEFMEFEKPLSKQELASRIAKERFEILVRGRDRAIARWRKVYALHLLGAKGGEASNEEQARAQYFLIRDQVQTALQDVNDLTVGPSESEAKEPEESRSSPKVEAYAAAKEDEATPVKIEFKGNSAVFAEKLRNLMRDLPPPPAPSSADAKGDAAPARDEALETLTDYYRGLGYFEATVKREDICDEQGNVQRVQYVIDEGKRCRVGEIKIKGVTNERQEELLKCLPIQRGGPFDRKAIETAIITMGTFYDRVPESRPRIEFRIQFHEQPGTIDLIFSVKEQPASTKKANENQAEGAKADSPVSIIPPVNAQRHYAVIYAVADLVTPVPNLVDPSSQTEPRPAEPDFEGLIGLVTSTVLPASWDAKGGQASLRTDQAAGQLVVSQTEEGHAQIAALLAQLRSLLDVQIVLESYTVVDADDLCSKLDIDRDEQLRASEVKRLCTHDNGDRRLRVKPGNKVTCFSGQRCKVMMGASDEKTPGCAVYFQPLLSSDRKTIDLCMATSTGDVPADDAPWTRFALSDGGGLIFETQIGDDPANKTAVLVAARVISAQSNEEPTKGSEIAR